MQTRRKIRGARSAPALASALVGTWALRTREDRTAGGEIRAEPSLGSDPIALLFFDGNGNFSAQFMKRKRGKTLAAGVVGGAANNSRAQGGYDAYFGTFAVDESHRTVTTRLVGALSPENVGQTFTREMSVAGNELTIRLETATPSGEAVTRTLRWKRVG